MHAAAHADRRFDTGKGAFGDICVPMPSHEIGRPVARCLLLLFLGARYFNWRRLTLMMFCPLAQTLFSLFDGGANIRATVKAICATYGARMISG